MADSPRFLRRSGLGLLACCPALIFLATGCPTPPPTPPDPCADVTCGEGETCVEGECVPDNGGPPADKGYVGSERCGDCHDDIFDSFMLTGHPFKLNAVTNGQAPVYPVTTLAGPPADITFDDAAFVIGGFRYKYRVVDNEGFIVLGPTAQYNFPSQAFGAYSNDDDHTAPDGTVGPWSSNIGRKPYNCGRCHTTGYDAEVENRRGMEGLVGDWEFEGIHCEECHGPGANHAEAIAMGDFDTARAEIVGNPETETTCGRCHTRSQDGIAASSGFVKHHEQWDEFKRSAHAAVMSDGCMTCHDPHKPLFDSAKLAGIQSLFDADGDDTTLDVMASPPGIIRECDSCHGDVTVTHAGPTACKTCHMAFTTKSGIATGPNSGDIRSHAWLINTDVAAMAFTDSEGVPVPRDDSSVTFAALNAEGRPYITLDFACLRCHGDHDAQWASDNSAAIHGS